MSEWNDQKIHWNRNRGPPVIETFLQKRGIIDNGKINNDEELVDYGLFFFLYWFFSNKSTYYFNPKNKNKVKGYFNFYVTSIGNNIIFLLQTEKDKFIFPKRNSTLITDPLNYLANGNKNHESCPLNFLIKYNTAYLKVNKKDFDIKLPESSEGGCSEHKKTIKKLIESQNEAPCILGGWPITLTVDKELIEGVESAEQLHEDSFFNEFLTIYLKYKLDLKGSYYNNVELQKPFQSHEIDAVLQLKNKIIMFETSIEFEIKPDNLKKKIYNLWSLHQYFEKAVTFYLTFGKIQDNTTKSFFEFHKQNTTKNDPHFEILHFPSTLKDIEYLLKDINKPSDLNNLQKKIKNDFIEFLHELEQKVRSYLKIPTAKY